MAGKNPKHFKAVELARQYLPNYMATWIVGTLLETQTIPVLIEHQNQLAKDVIAIAQQLEKK